MIKIIRMIMIIIAIYIYIYIHIHLKIQDTYAIIHGYQSVIQAVGHSRLASYMFCSQGARMEHHGTG